METFEGLFLIDTYVLQEQPMMLTGINLQLEDRVIPMDCLKDKLFGKKYILRLPLNKYVLEVKWQMEQIEIS